MFRVWQNAEFPDLEEVEEVKEAENINSDDGTSASTSVQSVPVPSQVKEPVRTSLEAIETGTQGNAARKKQCSI